MVPFEQVAGRAVPMPAADINTDQIVPGRFMHKPRDDYGRYCFHDLRFDAQGMARPEFVLNRPEHADAAFLVAGPNFGCGSSREHAVFTLVDYGFRAILAPSFGDIFRINSLKNGLLPVELGATTIDALLARIAAQPPAEITIDLDAQRVRLPGTGEWAFEIDAFSRECLLRGFDELDLTLSLSSAIDAYEARTDTAFPITAPAVSAQDSP